jgi:hypothetical protein
VTFKNILVIGPGSIDPFKGILDWFPTAHVTAVEIDTASSDSLSAKYYLNARLRIVNGDAADLSMCAPGPYDLICIRHPDLDRDIERWTRVFAQAVANLAEGHPLIITTYSLAECSVLQQMLKQQSSALLATTLHSDVPVDLQGNDRYVLVYRRIADAH